MELDSALIQAALETARLNGFEEVEIADGDDLFRAEFLPGIAPKPSEEPGIAIENHAVTPFDIKAHLVGFYRERPTGLKVGMRVAEGESIAVISALGIANDVESPVAGEVLEVFIQSGQPLQYGQVIAKVQTK